MLAVYIRCQPEERRYRLFPLSPSVFHSPILLRRSFLHSPNVWVLQKQVAHDFLSRVKNLCAQKVCTKKCASCFSNSHTSKCGLLREERPITSLLLLFLWCLSDYSSFCFFSSSSSLVILIHPNCTARMNTLLAHANCHAKFLYLLCRKSLFTAYHHLSSF